MMKKKMDIIDQKRLELNTYVAQYNSAISLITGTIDSLGSISQNMADRSARSRPTSVTWTPPRLALRKPRPRMIV